MTHTVFQGRNGKPSRPVPEDFEAQVGSRLEQLAALDKEIAELTEQTAVLPEMLTALERHPVLWLLLGREGVDRPGHLEGIVGQQVITVTRHNTRTLLWTALGMLLLGVVLGGGGMLVWMGGV